MAFVDYSFVSSGEKTFVPPVHQRNELVGLISGVMRRETKRLTYHDKIVESAKFELIQRLVNEMRLW
jgi:hypothetical protein